MNKTLLNRETELKEKSIQETDILQLASVMGNQAVVQRMVADYKEYNNNDVIQCMRILDSGVLAKNINIAARERRMHGDEGDYVGLQQTVGDQAHHIIPNEVVVEALDHISTGLIGGSFSGVAVFFDQAWNGIFMGSDTRIPRHTGNHSGYTNVVRKIIGNNLNRLVTDADYAVYIATQLRGTLQNYRNAGVLDLSDSGTDTTVRNFYIDIAFKSVREHYEGLDEYNKEQFRTDLGIRGPRFLKGAIDQELLFKKGVEIYHHL